MDNNFIKYKKEIELVLNFKNLIKRFKITRKELIIMKNYI